MIDGIAAARTLLGFTNLTPGMCLHYVWQAYKAHGARANGSWPTAYAAWRDTPGKHEGDRNPPPGVPVWFGPRPGSDAGDVVISLGGGRVACTDYPTWGRTGSCTIDERQRQIGRPYLGWTETILGAAIALPDNTTPDPEEDDMYDDKARAELNQKLDDIRDGLGLGNARGATPDGETMKANQLKIARVLWAGGPDVDAQLGATNSVFGMVIAQQAQLGALTAALANVQAGNVDLAAVTRAAEEGARRAIDGLTLTASA